MGQLLSCKEKLNDSVEKEYCCSLKCFIIGWDEDEVDGRACRKCLSFGICRCKCRSYMKNIKGKNTKK